MTIIFGIIEQKRLLERTCKSRDMDNTVKSRKCVYCKGDTLVSQMTKEGLRLYFMSGVCETCQLPILNLRIPTSDDQGISIGQARSLRELQKMPDEPGYDMMWGMYYMEAYNNEVEKLTDKNQRMLALHLYVCDRACRHREEGLAMREPLHREFMNETGPQHKIKQETKFFKGTPQKID